MGSVRGIQPLFGVLVYELLNGGFMEDKRIADLHALQFAVLVPAVNGRDGNVQVVRQLLSPEEPCRL